MFALLLSALLAHLAPHMHLPSPIASALGVTAVPPLVAFARVLWRMLTAVTFGASCAEASHHDSRNKEPSDAGRPGRGYIN